MRFFYANRPVSPCQLISFAIVFFLFGWMSSNIINPSIAYLNYTPSEGSSHSNENDKPSANSRDPRTINVGLVEEHLVAHPSSSIGVKLVCMVITAPNTTQSKAVEGVKATWGRRCDQLVFVSSQRNDSVPTIACNCSEGFNFLWGKVKAGFTYVHQHFNKEDSEYDWFLKADDDTYVIMENLKAQLARYDPKKPLILGRRFSNYLFAAGYMAGGPGYVLSKAALKSFVEIGLLTETHKTQCRKKERGIEDVEMGFCLHGLGVDFVDTRDPEDKLETFIPHHPEESLNNLHNETASWVRNLNYYKDTPDNGGTACCSHRSATFHKLNASMMQTMEYFLYRFKMNR